MSEGHASFAVNVWQKVSSLSKFRKDVWGCDSDAGPPKLRAMREWGAHADKDRTCQADGSVWRFNRRQSAALADDKPVLGNQMVKVKSSSPPQQPDQPEEKCRSQTSTVLLLRRPKSVAPLAALVLEFRAEDPDAAANWDPDACRRGHMDFKARAGREMVPLPGGGGL